MHEYKNDKITVKWDSKVCIHSAVCIHALSSVFDTSRTPWVNINGADSNEIAKTIKNCPSGALSYQLAESSETKDEISPNVEIKLQENGPLNVTGNVKIIAADGTETIKTGKFSLCRCGGSSKKPFCDGTHKKIGFIS